MSDPRPESVAEPLEAEVLLDQFDAAWRAGTAPNLVDFLPPAGPLRGRLLEELIKIDLEYRWRGLLGGAIGPVLEEYLARADELGLDFPISLDLICEEYWVRHRFGDRPGTEEYLRRFPEKADNLAALLGRIYTELTHEFLRRSGEPLANQAEPLAAVEAAAPFRPIINVNLFVDFLDRSTLLNDIQRDELQRSLRPRFPELRALAKELLTRGWLTVFQLNRILEGRGQDLQIGPHVLLARLGEGATGWVYKARHVLLRRLVAVKVLREHLLGDSEALNRFYREIQVISQLAHPHVIHAYDAGPIEGKHVLVMEYVEGQDLLTLIREEGPLSWEAARRYTIQAARGLQHIHDRGLIHRDIKPSNLLLCKTSVHDGAHGTIKVLDLGLARLGRIGRQAPEGRLAAGASSQLTPRLALGVGTPDFMAPEQALDFHSADGRADIYSLGCTLYFLLTGQPPFPGGTTAGKLLRHHEETPSWDLLPADVPERGRDLLRRMMSKDPKQRPLTGNDVCRALGAEVAVIPATVEAKPVAASPPPSSGPDLVAFTGLESSRRSRTHKKLAGLMLPLLVLGLVGLTIGGIAYLQSGHPASHPKGKPPTHVLAVVEQSIIAFEPGFGAGEGLRLNGSAHLHDGQLVLTDDGNQAASAFTTERLPIQVFSTEFTFEIRGKQGEMADGLSFTIQDAGADALGSLGGGLGYGVDPTNAGSNARIRRSVAVKFDLYDNNGEGTNSTGLYENGAAPGAAGSINLHGTGIDLHSQHIFRVRLHYAGAELNSTISDTVTGASHSHAYHVNLPAILGSMKGHVGFTAGTGGLSARQVIRRWKFSTPGGRSDGGKGGS